MEVQELRPGLWRWTAVHPQWKPEPNGWDPTVGCLYYEAPDAVVLVDPLVPPDEAERFWRALDRDVKRAARPVAVLLTVFWHERSAAELIERYGASLWSDARTVERIDTPPTDSFRAGDRLPGEVVAYEAHGRNECLLWIERHRSLVAGDILHGDDSGGVRLCADSWLHPHLTGDDVRRLLRPLLDLPIEMVLTAHGEPVLADGRAALERALEVA